MTYKEVLDKLNISYPGLNDSALEDLRMNYSFDSLHYEILSYSNGFYIKNSSLHFFGYNQNDYYHDLDVWNESGLWKDEYIDLIDRKIFFAETIFGDQFYYDNNFCIYKFLAETAHSQLVASDFTTWIEMVLKDSFEMIDDDILLDWIGKRNIKIIPGTHLVPRIPFCLGGEIVNINDGYIASSVNDMRFKGQLATQLKNIQPGERVDLTAINLPEELK